MINEVLLEAQQRMTASVEAVGRELTTVRTGRANTSILDDVVVDYYGAPTPLRQLASLSAPDPQMLALMPPQVQVRLNQARLLARALAAVGPADKAVVKPLLPQLDAYWQHEWP